jgi:2-dehydro-3-deoxyphosphooctonate aldolase (KDO 8-P synthase)
MSNRLDKLYEDLKNAETFFLIGGPCVIEDEYIMMQTAEKLKTLTADRKIPFVFKSSFTKANRTSGTSYAGPGIEKGLKLLQKISETFELPILTDIHETIEADIVAEVVDIIQIPAFLCRQTALIVAAALTGKIVNIKKGQFLAPEDMINPVEKATSTGNFKLMLTERGSSFGYHNLVVDMRSFAQMQAARVPILYDVTHSMQKPSLGNVSGGTPQYAPMMACAALATGCVDGLFIEAHPNPAEALSDAQTQLPLYSIGDLLDRCIDIVEVVRR